MTTHFNATLSTKVEINDYLTVGSSHVSEDGLKIYTKQSNGTLGESVLHNDPQRYLNSIDASSIEGMIAKFIINPEFKRLFDCSEYTINIVNSQYFKVDCSQGLPSIIVTSVHDGGYFDLVGYSATSALTYSTHHIEGFIHSGDQTFSENYQQYLFHSITPDASVSEQNIVIGACGYNKTPLHRFIGKNPVIMCLDHTLKTINIVACPIDQATIGEATLSFFLSCKYQNNVMKISVITPKCASNANTGDTTHAVMAKVRLGLAAFDDTERVAEEVPVETTVIHRKESPATVENLSEKSCFQFSDCGRFIDIPKSCDIDTFNGFGHKSSRENDIKIPFQYGPCSGSKSLVLGKPPQAPITYDDISASHVIHHVSLQGYDHFTSTTNEFVGNGIFIIHLTSDEFENISETKILALSMMGPRSFVALEFGDKYFYYRGQAEHFSPQEFGTEVPDFIEKLVFWLATPLMFPTCSRKNDTSVFVLSHGTYHNVSLTDFLVIPETMTKEDTDDFFANIAYVMDQFQVSCTSDELDSVSKKILSILNKGIDVMRKLLTEDMKRSLTEGDIEGMKTFAHELKRCESEFNKDNQVILAKLNNLVSQKGVISKNHSLERINRKVTIKNNVSDVLSMSPSAIFESSLDENGVIVLNINITKFKDVLKMMSEFHRSGREDFGSFVSSEKFVSKPEVCFDCLDVSTRAQILDDETIKVIAEVTNERVHDLTGCSGCVALPSMDSEYRTCIPIPLGNEFMTAVAPDFKNLANDKKFASFRISLRNTISQAHSTREFQIPADSTLLGTVTCMIVLESLETFTQGMSGLPEEGSTRQQVIRGLLGFVLTTMASGVNGQLKCWEVFSDKPSVPESLKSWQITQRIMLQARLAGWITPKVLKQYKNITKNYIAFAANDKTLQVV